MGPFELVDLVGLDVRLNILDICIARSERSIVPIPCLRQYVQEGRLGRKTGRGVYDLRAAKSR